LKKGSIWQREKTGMVLCCTSKHMNMEEGEFEHVKHGNFRGCFLWYYNVQRNVNINTITVTLTNHPSYTYFLSLSISQTTAPISSCSFIYFTCSSIRFSSTSFTCSSIRFSSFSSSFTSASFVCSLIRFSSSEHHLHTPFIVP